MKSLLKVLPFLLLLLLINAKIVVFNKSDGTKENYYVSDLKTIGFDVANVGVHPVRNNHTINGISINLKTGKIQYAVQEKSSVRINLYNSQGRFIRTFDRSLRTPGTYEIAINKENYSSGIYVIVADLNGKRFSQRMIITR